MDVRGFTPVYPMPSLADAVPFYARVLGVEPTYVDGDRWAQFDVRGRRVALCGPADRIAEEPALMVKVAGIEQARRELADAGIGVGEIHVGAHEHERRCVVEAPGGWVVMLYDPSVLGDREPPRMKGV
jgi:hypothetical protein